MKYVDGRPSGVFGFKLKLTAVILVFLILVSIVYIWAEQNTLALNVYNVETQKLNTSVKVALISDLHNKEFGRDNERLVRKIAEQKPDFIAIVGDMNTDTNPDYSVMIKLLKQLVEISPVYYVPGNHEATVADESNIVQDIRATGVTYLSNEGIFFEKNGEKLYIGGLKQYPYFEFDYPEFDNPERHFFDSFREIQKEYFSILLCHQPECYMWSLSEYDIDLMLSGHTHGGLVRIPFIGGLRAPNQKWFPEYDKGEFFSGTARMIITGGLGDTHIIPRINNTPEVCIININ